MNDPDVDVNEINKKKCTKFMATLHQHINNS